MYFFTKYFFPDPYEEKNSEDEEDAFFVVSQALLIFFCKWQQTCKQDEAKCIDIQGKGLMLHILYYGSMMINHN